MALKLQGLEIQGQEEAQISSVREEEKTLVE